MVVICNTPKKIKKIKRKKRWGLNVLRLRNYSFYSSFADGLESLCSTSVIPYICLLPVCNLLPRKGCAVRLDEVTSTLTNLTGFLCIHVRIHLNMTATLTHHKKAFTPNCYH